jgi:hypothetical protein
MKKILLTSLMALIMLTFTACVTKSTPNLRGKPDNTATVFIYIPSATGTMDGMSNIYYELYIDDKHVRGRISDGEHKRLYLRPGSTKLSIVRAHMSPENIVIDLKDDEVYFLKVSNVLDTGMTQFTQMDNETGKQEFALTRCMVIPETDNVFEDFVK